MLVTTMDQKTYIEQVLDSKGLTIDWLAREADMSYSQTWDIVKRGIKSGTRIGNIEKLASALGVSVVDLLDKHPRQE